MPGQYTVNVRLPLQDQAILEVLGLFVVAALFVAMLLFAHKRPTLVPQVILLLLLLLQLLLIRKIEVILRRRRYYLKSVLRLSWSTDDADRVYLTVRFCLINFDVFFICSQYNYLLRLRIILISEFGG